MKTIEERADAYVGHPEEIDEFTSETIKRDAYIRGAKEQKAIDEEVRLKKCDDMTEEEYERELDFAEWYNKNGKGTPTFSDAIEWAREEVIEKACEWLNENAQNYYCDASMHDNCWYDDEHMIEDFQKAMEE